MSHAGAGIGSSESPDFDFSTLFRKLRMECNTFDEQMALIEKAANHLNCAERLNFRLESLSKAFEAKQKIKVDVKDSVQLLLALLLKKISIPDASKLENFLQGLFSLPLNKKEIAEASFGESPQTLVKILSSETPLITMTLETYTDKSSPVDIDELIAAIEGKPFLTDSLLRELRILDPERALTEPRPATSTPFRDERDDDGSESDWSEEDDDKPQCVIS